MICSRCHVDHPASDYAPSAVARGSGYCRTCHRAYYAGWRRDPVKNADRKRRDLAKIRANPALSAVHSRRTRHKELRRRYGITLAEYEARLAAQGSRCACCGSEDPGGPSFRVDHDHATGAIRGLLCNRCNSGIGMLGDTPEGVAKALTYLQASGAHCRTHDTAGDAPAELQ
jgi:hypothetical protein